MTIKKASEKIKKYTGAEVEKVGYQYSATVGKKIIEFSRNGGDDCIVCIRVRGVGDTDDSQSDYFAGAFYENISQAIKAALRQ